MNSENITESINAVIGLRNDARQKAITETAQKVYGYLKQFNYKTITRDTLNSFFSSEINIRVKQLITTEILKELVSHNKIRKTTSIKQGRYFFRVKPLITQDFESYSVLMVKNGFMSYCYNYDYNRERQIPIKVLKGVVAINQPSVIKDNCDAIENRSYKARDKQGVYSQASISIARVKNKFSIVSYQVL